MFLADKIVIVNKKGCHMKRKKIQFPFSLVLLLLAASCIPRDSSNQIADESQQKELPQEDIQTATVETIETVESALIQDEFREVAIPASDGKELDGIFYPASSENSPLVILFHWAPGDQTDWREIAFWLQNRGFGEESQTNTEPWLDPSWFPDIEEEWSFNVLTFNFRGCSGGCGSFNREGWLIDAQSAAEYGFEMEGIDREKIIMVGASIGADGAADACLYLNKAHRGSCRGSFSISPGDYLTIDFQSVVKDLGEVPVRCLFAESDVESAGICGDFQSANFMAVSYSSGEVKGNGHGMNLVEPDLDPNPLELLRDFVSDIL